MSSSAAPEGNRVVIQSIQDSFLNNARRDRLAVTIYLMSGVKLTGRIKNFDKYSLVLESNSNEQLIFKHAISTIAGAKSAVSAPRPAAPVPAPDSHEG